MQQTRETRNEVCPRVYRWRLGLQRLTDAVYMLEQELPQAVCRGKLTLGTTIQTRDLGL